MIFARFNPRILIEYRQEPFFPYSKETLHAIHLHCANGRS